MGPTQRIFSFLAVPAVLTALLFAPRAGAAWYQVELLVFANQDRAAYTQEHWPADPGTPSAFDTVALQRPDSPYPAAAESDGSLNAHRLQLRRSGRYEPLLHLRWRQPIGAKSKSRRLWIQDPATGGANSRLLGTVQLYRGRFLHVDLDLVYRNPAAYGDPTAPQAFRFREHRRMRRDELHYIDHPVLGALIIIKPLAPAGSETAQEEELEEIPGEESAAEENREPAPATD